MNPTMHPPFTFSGSLPPSKSLLIRQLLLQLYEPRIEIPLLSACHDVVVMQGACTALRSDSQEVHCGEAGLVLRLMLGAAARRGGDFILSGTPRLLERPHGPLFTALSALGARIDFESSPRGPVLRVRSTEFSKPAAPLELRGALSSQFLSSLILNAWGLPFTLSVRCDAAPFSEGYSEMTIDVARRFGMTIEIEREDAATNLLHIPPNQQPQPGTCPSEADVSSAFSVAGVAAVAGTAHIENFPAHSLQPDRAFVEILQQMNVPLELTHGLTVHKSPALRPIEANLGGAPDLFPVLAVLCALADGRSLLFGAPQLRGKESDRVATTCKLLTAIGRRAVPRDDGAEIFGQPPHAGDQQTEKTFDAGSDHRLVMAAAVAVRAGIPLKIHGLSAVKKSFPEFLSITGIDLSK